MSGKEKKMRKAMCLMGMVLVLQGAVRVEAAGLPGGTGKEAASRPAGEATSKPVEKDGLAATVTLPQGSFAAGETIKFTVTLKNVSKEPLLLFDAKWFWGWGMVFTDVQTGERWGAMTLLDRVRNIPRDPPLQPGERLEVPVQLGFGDGSLQFMHVDKDAKFTPTIMAKQLPPGKYRLTVGVVLRERPNDKESDYWTGAITTEPLEVTFMQKAGAQTRAATRGGEAGVVVADVVADGAAAVRIEKALPKGWSVLRVEKNQAPYTSPGPGVAVFLVSERHAKDSKVAHDAVVFIMPADYDDGGVDPHSGQFQTSQAELIGTVPAGKIYVWSNGMGWWKTIDADVLKALGKPASLPGSGAGPRL